MLDTFTWAAASSFRPLSLALIFLLVVLAVFVAGSVLAGRRAISRRLVQSIGASERTPGASLRSGHGDSAWAQMLIAIEARGLPLTDSNAALGGQLAAAGYSGLAAQKSFSLIRLLLTLGLPLLFLAVALSSAQPPSLIAMYAVGSFLALLGLYGPKLWIAAKADRRRQAITNGFPDVLDLMLVCVEAGLGLEAAFNRVGAEMARAHPLLSEMLGILSLELRAGRERAEALRRLADRAGVEEIRSFATLLIQGDKLGTSIAQTLRVFSAEMREKRRMRAEEKAHRLPVLLSIPLVAFMLPTMIGVLMLPAGIRVVRQLMPALTGE